VCCVRRKDKAISRQNKSSKRSKYKYNTPYVSYRMSLTKLPKSMSDFSGEIHNKDVYHNFHILKPYGTYTQINTPQ